jgi:hypothetical protein
MNTHRPPRKMSVNEASDLAERAFLFLAANDERLQRFMDLSGFDAANARQAASMPGFFAGVLSYLMSDEQALLAFAETDQCHPLSIPLAYRVIPGGDPTLEINTGW